MKKIVATSTETFEENVSEGLVIKFSKVKSSNNTTIYGKIIKNETEVGTISYDKNVSHVTTQIKPFNRLSSEEYTALNASIAACVLEIIEGDGEVETEN